MKINKHKNNILTYYKIHLDVNNILLLDGIEVTAIASLLYNVMVIPNIINVNNSKNYYKK